MEENKLFAYKKEFKDDYIICIMYQWEAYYVGRLLQRGNTHAMAYTLRKYKTLSGAEKYLLTKINHGLTEKDTEAELSYGTEAYIKKGEYWR